MAEQVTLGTVSTFTNDSSAVATVNSNSVLIENAFVNVLDRYGTSPNEMNAVLDMNNFNIINLPSPSTVNSPARLVDVVSNPTISVPTVGTSGATVPLLNGTNTWTGSQDFSGAIVTLPSNPLLNSIVLSGTVSGTTTIQPGSTTPPNNILSLPTSTDTLVGKATSDTLTNKTYDTAGTGNVFKVNGTTLSMVTGSGNVVLATSPSITTPTISQPTINGVTDGSDAASGVVGEVLTATGSVSIATGTAINVTSLVLTAGDWDLTGAASWPSTNTGTGVVYCNACINTVITTMTQTAGHYATVNPGVAWSVSIGSGVSLPTLRVSVTTPTTYYLNTQTAFATAGGSVVNGYLYARRVR